MITSMLAVPPPTGLANDVSIEGVHFRNLDTHVDERGAFTEVFQARWNTGLTPVQWSVVRSNPRVFRGMHLHKRHDEYFSLISGRALVGLRDMRPWSPTLGNHALFEMTGDRPSCVAFPRGLLHGWYFAEESIHVQAVSESYADYGMDDNMGCHWADPDIGIKWPFSDAILAPRAKGFPAFRELEASLSTWVR